MFLKHILGRFSCGALAGLALTLSLPAMEFSEHIENVHSQIGSNVTDQHASIVKILIGNRVPRPQMQTVTEELCRCGNTFRYSFDILQNYFADQVLPDSFQDGAELKTWFKKNMLPVSETDSDNLYAQYGEIMTSLDSLFSVLFTGTVNDVTQAILTLIGGKLDGNEEEETPKEESDTAEKVITLTGTVDEIQNALNTLTTPPVTTPTEEEEEEDDDETPVTVTLIERLDRFMEEIDPGEGRKAVGGVYDCIEQVKHDESQNSNSVRYVSEHLFRSLYSSATKLRYELQNLPVKVNEIHSTLTDQVFMDNVVTRISSLEAVTMQILKFLGFRIQKPAQNTEI